jgi:hypothetical protein
MITTLRNPSRGSVSTESARPDRQLAKWLVGCALLGWLGAVVLEILTARLLGVGVKLILAPVVSFAAAGWLASTRLRAGWPERIGCVITYGVGNVSAFLPIMRTQAMNGRESVIGVVAFATLWFTVAFGVTAALGFAGVALRDRTRYLRVVAAFGVGGFGGGVLLAVGIEALRLQDAVGALLFYVAGVAGLLVPFAVAGFVFSRPSSTSSVSVS